MATAAVNDAEGAMAVGAEGVLSSVQEQLRRSIRQRFGSARRFTIRTLRESCPELSHVLNLAERLGLLVESGFIRIARSSEGANQNAADSKLARYVISEVSSEDGITVRKRRSGYSIDLDTRWCDRLDAVTHALGISAVIYLREVVCSDIVRRSD